MDESQFNESNGSFRSWRTILSEIKSPDDLLTRQGQEMYELPRDQLPPAVQRWQAAFGLSLWLGNGWSDVSCQHLSDLHPGVAGFAECGFDLGYQSGQEVLNAFRLHGLDPASASFEEDFRKVSESIESQIEADVTAIDDQTISDIWDQFDILNELLIRRAQQLAGASD